MLGQGRLRLDIPHETDEHRAEYKHVQELPLVVHHHLVGEEESEVRLMQALVVLDGDTLPLDVVSPVVVVLWVGDRHSYRPISLFLSLDII